MRSKKIRQNQKLVDKFLQYRTDFYDICKDYELDPEMDKKEILSWLVEIADNYLNEHFCPLFKLRSALTKNGKQILGDNNFSKVILDQLVDTNRRIEDDKITEKYVQKQKEKQLSDLFISNFMKRSFDASVDDTYMSSDNHFVAPKKGTLKFSDKTEKNEDISKIITSMTDSRREFDTIAFPYYKKILHAMTYITDGKISDMDAVQIMKYRHCPDGGFEMKKNPMRSMTEKFADAYRLITKNNLSFHENNIDDLNYWLQKHGLKVIELENYEDAEKNYKQYAEQMDKEWDSAFG